MITIIITKKEADMKRYSKQREVIMNNMKDRYDHPTAEMVYDTVRAEIPNISLGTVYRNLKELAAGKEILSFTQNGKEHFDGNIAPHIHRCCVACGSIEDRILEEKDMELYTKDDFKIKNIIIQGFCKKCSGNISQDEI